MTEELNAVFELVAQTCLYAESEGRQGSVSVVGLDPDGDILVPVRVRDDHWRAALASVPTLLQHFREQGRRPMLLLFCFGIGDVAFLYDQQLLDRFANAISNSYEAGAGDAGDDSDVEVVCAFGRELEARDIAVTFIGEEFAWIFDRSTSTFAGGADAHQPPVPILTAAGWATPRCV
jgi:hypothetical protein